MPKPKKIRDSEVEEDMSSIIDQIMNPYSKQAEPILDVLPADLPSTLLMAAQIEDAYNFRNLIEYVRPHNIDANLCFTSRGIEYMRSNGLETVFNTFLIRSTDIQYYISDAENEITVGINLNTVSNVTKNIGKKEVFRLFYCMDTRDKLFYEIATYTHLGLNVQSRGIIAIKQVDSFPALLPDYGEKPIYVGSTAQFCHNCSIMVNQADFNVSNIRIVCYERGLHLESIDNYGQVIHVLPFGPSRIKLIKSIGENIRCLDITKNAPDVDFGSIITTINVKKQVIRCLSKMANISENGGLLRIYALPDEAVKFQMSIGHCGVFETFIKQHQTE